MFLVLNNAERAVNFTARAALTLRPLLPRGLGNIRSLDKLDAASAFPRNLSIEQDCVVSKHHGHDVYRGDPVTLFFLVEGAFLILLKIFHNNTCPVGRLRDYTFKVIECQGLCLFKDPLALG